MNKPPVRTKKTAVSVINGRRKLFYLMGLGAAAVIIILLLGLVVSATSDRSLVTTHTEVREADTGIYIYATGARDDPQKPLRYIEFTVDFENNDLLCDVGNPNYAGLGWQTALRQPSDTQGYITKYKIYYDQLIPLVRKAKEMLDDESFGPVNVDRVGLCIKVANSNLSGYWQQSWRPITLDSIYFEEAGRTTVNIRTAVVQDDYSIYASTASWGPDELYWKYTLVEAGARCDRSTFNHPPNHPGIHHSNQFIIKESNYASYRNKHLCFEAVDSDNRYLHASHKIDLGNPVIAVKEENNFLIAVSDEEVSWRIGRAKNLIVSQMDPYLQRAGSLCEQVFAGSASESLGKFNSTSDGSNKVRIIGGYRHYCFEATDSEGNRSYLEPTNALGIRVFAGVANSYQQPATTTVIITPYLLGVSGDIHWEVAGPSDLNRCDQGAFDKRLAVYGSTMPLQSYTEATSVYNRDASNLISSYYDQDKFAFTWLSSAQNKNRIYYCLRATDELGVQHYRPVNIKDFLNAARYKEFIKSGKLMSQHFQQLT